MSIERVKSNINGILPIARPFAYMLAGVGLITDIFFTNETPYTLIVFFTLALIVSMALINKIGSAAFLHSAMAMFFLITIFLSFDLRNISERLANWAYYFLFISFLLTLKDLSNKENNPRKSA